MLYLDNDVPMALAPLLGMLGVPAVHTRAVGRQSASDDDQLLFATANGWAIVTHNERDYLLVHLAWERLAGHWDVTPRPLHGGVIVVPQQSGTPQATARAIAALVRRSGSVAGQVHRRGAGGWQRWSTAPVLGGPPGRWQSAQ